MPRTPAPKDIEVKLKLPDWLLRRAARDGRLRSPLEEAAGRELVERAIRETRA